MKFNTILNRYIFMELFPPFAVNMFFFTFILLISKILEIANMVVNYQAGLSSIFLLLLYAMPFFLAFVTPMSIMMAILLTFLRLSSDNEMVALKSCGLNPATLLAPVALFCLTGWLLTTVIMNWMLPWANRSFYDLSADLALSHIDAVIKERTFVDNFDGLVLYVNQIDLQRRSLVDVFIEDQRTPGFNNTIVAPRGRITTDLSAQKIRLRLVNGTINRVDLKTQRANAINFNTYETNLDINKIQAKATKERRPLEEMTWGQLGQYLKENPHKDKRYYKALMKYHEKLSLPAACFALGLLALPLGLQARTGKRSMGIVMGIGLFLLNYIMLSVGWALGESGTLHPAVGMWAPNILMGATGTYLFVRVLKEKPMFPIIQLGRIKQRSLEKSCQIDTKKGPHNGGKKL